MSIYVPQYFIQYLIMNYKTCGEMHDNYNTLNFIDSYLHYIILSETHNNNNIQNFIDSHLLPFKMVDDPCLLII